MRRATMNAASTQSKYRSIAGLLLLVTALVYWPVRTHDFINFDDPDYVSSNPRVLAGLTWDGVLWAFTNSHSSNWHPLTWMSHMLDCDLFGAKPAGPHLVNLLFHLTNTLLLFGLLRRLTGALWRSAMVAALFALHPLHVESVAWIAERKDVLSTFFGLLTIGAYARYVDQSKVQSPKSKVSFALALLFFALGLLSKPMLVTWPFLLLLLDFWPLRRFQLPFRSVPGTVWRRLLAEKIPFLAITVASSVITLIVQRGAGAAVPFDVLSAGARLAQMPVAYARYLGKTFWPDSLAVFYPYVNYDFGSPIVLGALLLMAALTGAACRQVRQWPFLAVGWFWFLGTLVPVIGLVQVGRQAIADRYTYIPLIGLFIAVVWLAAELAARWKIPRAAQVIFAALILAVCTGLTARQVGYWRDTATLAAHTARVTTGNYMAHAQLAGVLAQEGKLSATLAECQLSLLARPDFAEAHNTLAGIYVKQSRFDEAIVSYREAARNDLKFPDPHHGLADLFLKLDRFAEAEAASQVALAIAPMHLPALFTLAQAQQQQGKLDDAIATYRVLLKLKPDLFAVRRGLGTALVLKGELPAATVELEEALRLLPNNPDTHNALGMVLLARNEVSRGSNHFSRALGLQPTNAIANYQIALLLASSRQDAAAANHYRTTLRSRPDEPEVLNNFAWLLATSPDDRVRDGREAIRLAEHACELTQHKEAMLLGTLAAAYAEAGRFDDAIATATQARDLARAARQDAVADRNEELLKAYRAHQPHRETPP